jgi:hypothetical protein
MTLTTTMTMPIQVVPLEFGTTLRQAAAPTNEVTHQESSRKESSFMTTFRGTVRFFSLFHCNSNPEVVALMPAWENAMIETYHHHEFSPIPSRLLSRRRKDMIPSRQREREK